MLSTQWTTRRTRDAEKLTEDAWDNLVAAMDSAGHTARTVADDAQTKVGAAADEALRRASAAVDALAGRRAALPWAWIAGAALAGAVVGWLGATAVKRALAAAEDDELLVLEPAGASADPIG